MYMYLEVFRNLSQSTAFYKIASPPSNDSNQPAQMRRLTEPLLRTLWLAKEPKFLETNDRGSVENVVNTQGDPNLRLGT